MEGPNGKKDFESYADALWWGVVRTRKEIRIEKKNIYTVVAHFLAHRKKMT